MSESEDRLVAILDGIGDSFYAVDRDWRLTVFNRGAEAFFGRARDAMVGRILWDVIPVREVPGLEHQFRDAMAGKASDTAIVSPSRPGRWLEGRVFPLPDGIGVSFRDLTARRADERALRQREAELAHVQRIAGIGGLQVELRGGFRNLRSPEYLALHGLPPEAAGESHEAWVARIHPDDRERTHGHFRDCVDGDAVLYSAEYRIIRPSDGETRWIAASAEIERDAEGRAIRLIGAHRDVTERKRSELQQRLMIHELNHRVKNTLATVQSIAAQSLRGESGSAEARQAFESRLMALSRAHDVLTRESWESADLRDIVERAAEPYRGGVVDRFEVDGESLRLAPRAALAVAMALQELATNAVKYGALSTPAGRVMITWTIARDLSVARPFRLSWREEGGPLVTAPKERGFGSRLIERNLAQDLEGDVALVFAPSGLTCTVQAPIPRAE